MVQILDTTLREGEQTPGVYFQPHVKLEIARYLEKVGVDIIETGHPYVSKNIRKSVKKISNSDINTIIGAHSRSLQEDVDTALECDVDLLGIFYCVSNDRLNQVFKTELSVAIKQITKTIAYAKDKNPNLIIRYTPEDTVRSKFENVIEASVQAVNAGADIISIADTTGYMIPGTDRSMYDYVSRVKDSLAKRGANPKIAVHCHDDRNLAIANALDGYRAGADIIDTTVLKLGERAGLVDLGTLLVILSEDFGEKNGWNLKKIPEVYEIVSIHSRIPIPVNFPITGENAFTNCAGLHTHAAAINPIHYQSINPEIVGRKMKVSLDHMSGLSSVRYALEQIGEENKEKEFISLILASVIEIGETGRTVGLKELEMIVKNIK